MVIPHQNLLHSDLNSPPPFPFGKPLKFLIDLFQ